MKLIGFDIETKGSCDTYGLQPYRVSQGQAEITSVAFVTEEGQTIFAKLWPTVEELRVILSHVENGEGPFEDAVLVGWNTQFDVSWLIAYGLESEVRACRWLDGEVLRR